MTEYVGFGDFLVFCGQMFKKETPNMTANQKSQHYEILNLGDAYAHLGEASEGEIFPSDDTEEYQDIQGVMLLKNPPHMIRKEVNGPKELSDYCQLESGILVPKIVAIKTGITHNQYVPQNKMFRYIQFSFMEVDT